ncbi:prostatic acid phosphatase-like isoform X2 [Dysidea avara]|uniref:prostatic acid phosphatase-like isoform X2 n=1 Tax=Dysidea avara TaxID=196820 RepID=UPI00332232FF
MMSKSQNDDKNLVPGTKVVFYSAHDYTVGAFFSALGTYDKEQPPYASTVFVELLSDSSTPKKYYVITSYLNTNTVDGFDLTNTSSLLVPMRVHGCNCVCPLENFTASLEELIPDDWQRNVKLSPYS